MTPAELLAALEAIACTTRLQMVSHLAGRPRGASVTEIAGAVGVTQSTATIHLAQLVRVGLVTRPQPGQTRPGRVVVHRLDRDRFRTLARAVRRMS